MNTALLKLVQESEFREQIDLLIQNDKLETPSALVDIYANFKSSHMKAFKTKASANVEKQILEWATDNQFTN